MGNTAIVALDIQVGIVDHMKDAVDTTNFLNRLSGTLVAARNAGVPVIQVTISLRDSYADASSRNPMLARVKAAGRAKDSDAASALHPAVRGEADIHVKKRRVSALHGTDLEVVLRSLDVTTLVLTGLATSGAVLSTLRQAADHDYEIVLLEDLCADPDMQLHEVLVKKVFPKQATVMKAEEWVKKLG
ncbi:isochorismatase family protein [Xylariomycetidae sp. FL0641]|nr:isochorismatase family protein [Xylariomycetidae sp. FL0641]